MFVCVCPSYHRLLVRPYCRMITAPPDTATELHMPNSLSWNTNSTICSDLTQVKCSGPCQNAQVWPQ